MFHKKDMNSSISSDTASHACHTADKGSMEAIEAARKVRATGTTAFEQGRALGALAKERIHEMRALKLAQYADTPGGAHELKPKA